MTDEHTKFDRRRFLATSGLLGGSMLAGCAGGNNDGQGTTTGGGGTTTESMGGGETTEEQQQNVQGGGTFIGTTAEDATTLDPRMNELAWVNSFLHYIFDTLYLPSPDGKKFVPHLASEQPKQQDETTFVIPLKEGVKFHNGDELTAEDVAYSINWTLDPENKSPNRANLNFVDSVEASGKYEATFNLKYPFALFQLVLSGMNAGIVPKSVAEKQGPKKFGQKPVGTGPFAFEKHVSSSHIDLTRNADYFLKKPNLGKIKKRVIPKPQVQFVELASGGVHQATVPKNLIGKAKSESSINMKRISQFDYNGLIFNSMRKPFDDVKVREAMQYLVDYDKMLKSTKGQLGKRAYGFMPTEVNKSWEFPWQEWKEKYYPAKDHQKAKQLLKEAGYGGGMDKTLKISSLASSKFKNMAIILQNELKKVGIKSEVREVTIGQWLNELDSGEFDVNIYGWSGGQDPDGFYYYLFRDMRNDEGGLSDGVVGNASAGYLYKSQDSDQLKQVDKKIRDARRTTDRAERKKLYIDAAETWQSLYPHIPVFSEQAVTGWSKDVKDYEPSAFAQQPLCNEWSNAYLQK
ncbi:ABC transporter substrate-binding protein [Halorussus limi]|uniref:ABC transporter substrate-binding protein n=1 Tax=Halorussus limi TaxID=2938695 RepID=A0A8U0HZR1_9EURY|nr:ABC transporter substrate-binding protein [Halorussus limi]UPV76034.1 ABC transporter substrate-binding protein [Halorussus limi]